MKKKNKQKKQKNKYYAIFSKTDNFLYGVFPSSQDGLFKAKEYLIKLDPSNKNYKIIKY